MIKHILAFLIGTIFTLVLYSCNDVNSFTLGQDLVDAKTNVIITDSCTIKAYTIKSDSVVTSGSGTALVGKYTDNLMGNVAVEASSYFNVAFPTLPIDINPNDDYVFDSLTLCLHYSHYFYGDTTAPYTIEAHELTEKIESRVNTNGYLFNTSSVDYYPSKFGEKTVRPRPSFHDSIHMRLDDVRGIDMLTKIMNREAQFDNAANFSDYFKGIVLKPGDFNKCVLGFYAADTSMYMRLHYHIGGTQYFIKFGLKNQTDQVSQFNRVIPDFSNSTLKDSPPKRLDDRISSDKTANQTYIQGSTGLMTRLEFPYLKTLLEGGNIKILSAELILSPIRNTYSMEPLPSSLVLNKLDNTNTNEGTLLTARGATLTPYLTIDPQYNEKTFYTFDLTSYITNVFQQTDNTIVPALGVYLSSDKNFSSLSRVILGDGYGTTNVSKLKITYWRY